MTPRTSVVSGMFYDNDFGKLNESIENAFLSKNGPGSLPEKRKQKDILGVVVPHAGYAFSGACAAWGYKEIAESRIADVYVLVGPNHTGLGTNSISLQDWQTPLGLVRTHQDFAKELIKYSGIGTDEMAHLKEHSLEVQLPFLQYACKDRLELLRIVAISLRDLQDIDKLSKAINELSIQMKKRVCLIISSDFTHFGPNYGYQPFRYEVKDSIYDLDAGAINQIKKLDRNEFLSYIRKNEMTICGYVPISFAIETLKNRAEKVKLLQYYTSGDITNDYTNSVSYASILFE
jgi:AmmeMemoRadiSam system protein B